MRFWQAYQLILLFTANFALALPIANINRAVEATQDPNCSRRDQTSSYRDLIHLASVIGEDDRRVLSQSTVGLTPAEKEQAMRCTGHVYCPNADGSDPKTFSAGAICPPGQRAAGFCAADRLATSAHGFVIRSRLTMNNNLSKCEFQNYRGHKSKLVVEDLRSIVPSELFDASGDPAKRRVYNRNDKVVVRLARPIPGCDPYDVAANDELPKPADEVIAVTYKQADQTMEQSDGTEPLVYGCAVTRVFAPKMGLSGATYSDCDLNNAGSGGFMLSRNANNRLVLSGVFSGSPAAQFNGRPYSAESNYTVAVTPTADFLELAVAPGTRPTLATDRGATPTARPTNN